MGSRYPEGSENLHLFENLADAGSKPALVLGPSVMISHDELVARADEVGKSLPPRSLVFCLASNTPESVIGYVGLQRANYHLRPLIR